MGYLVAIGLTAGIIAGVFSHLVFIAGVLPVIVWVAFAGEATFFAAGGKNMGFVKGLASNLAGVFWAAVIFFIVGAWASPLSMGLAVFLAVVMMCIQAKIEILSFIPGAFIGAACLFGTASADFPSGNIVGVVIALVLGAVMGWVAEKAAGPLAGLIAKKFPEKAVAEQQV
ncbi:DUF1097 domain-containing protein [Acetobacterium wieringae]|uniref:DUF1097 domain-containing protein n=1 Tax=Acetobacterium wieringae TaxID=52694 RepID=A0ABY6HE57_9FIRM|nr:DUF1097 domain-containing protein [Acetobacterium wieringae]UYO62580.1 DUF1097 domain-containing protein [Acetobacterium wieringae]